MRTNGALLSLLFISSACVGTVFADGVAGGGGGGGDTPPQHLTGIQNQHAEEEAEQPSTGVPRADSPTPPESSSSASAGRTAATNTDTGSCSAVDGSSCSSTAAAAAATTTAPPGKHQPTDEPRGEEGAVKVETGEHDGVRIEFVGRTEGTIPEPERPAALAPSARDAAAAAAEMMKFELLRCDGESHRDGTAEGGLTAKGIWNHLRSKLESSWEDSAQWVRRRFVSLSSLSLVGGCEAVVVVLLALQQRCCILVTGCCRSPTARKMQRFTTRTGDNTRQERSSRHRVIRNTEVSIFKWKIGSWIRVGEIAPASGVRGCTLCIANGPWATRGDLNGCTAAVVSVDSRQAAPSSSTTAVRISM